jgi:2-oxoglutarate dehydrogenase E2 component (dihydrolipoamide succinyltransferase)
MSSGVLSEIKVPALGESIREATVTKWLKAVGDPVKADEVLVELETDKVTLEVGSPSSGVLTEVHVSNGGTVSVGDILGLVAPEGALKQEGKEDISQHNKMEINFTSIKPTTATFDASAVQQRAPAAPPIEQKPIEREGLAPSVRRMAEELMLNAKEMVGTGKGGRVTKEDVINLSENKTTLKNEAEVESQIVQQSVRTSDQREERVKMSRLRQRIAERLKQAQNTAAILTTFNEVDMSFINALRGKYKEDFEKKHGVRLGMMSFFVKACVQALREFPAVNAEIDGDEIIYKNYYDIGVAVSTPQGLVVPVVRNADLLTFAEIEAEIAALGHKARDGKVSIAEMTGGTFTVTNGGVFGSLLATPILNPPQTGILGMHKMEDRPVVINGKIEIRSMMYLALSYDHRVIDGRESVSFLVRVKENLENPERLLLDM